MTWAVNHPHRQQRLSSAGWTAAGTATRPVRVPWVGLFIVLLGAWGAIAPFVGPVFGYQPTSSTSWEWTTLNWLLHLIPGAMAFVAGLAILGWAPAWASVKARSALAFAALLTIVAGAWFVIGPALWPWFESSAPYGPATDAQTSFINQVGANLGPGVLLAMLGGMALKTALSARRMAGGMEPAGTALAGDTEGAPIGDGGYGREAAASPATERRMVDDPAATSGTDRRAMDERRAAERGTMDDPTAAERGPLDERRAAERGSMDDPTAANATDRGAEGADPTAANDPRYTGGPGSATDSRFDSEPGNPSGREENLPPA